MPSNAQGQVSGRDLRGPVAVAILESLKSLYLHISVRLDEMAYHGQGDRVAAPMSSVPLIATVQGGRARRHALWHTSRSPRAHSFAVLVA